MNDHPYTPLIEVLQDAYKHAAHGKGKQRHQSASDQPFREQPMMTIAEICGVGFPAGQALKKIQEAMGMVDRGEFKQAEAELLGAINYCAGAIVRIRDVTSQE
jgi:hypothetical protein